jgi:transcriptional regulator CtsR
MCEVVAAGSAVRALHYCYYAAVSDGFISQVETRNSYFICKSRNVSIVELGKRTGADLIFSLELGGGYLHVMKFNCQKKHSYVEARIAKVDSDLNATSATTSFERVGADGQKVRSFGSGGRQQDPLFRMVFNVYSNMVEGEYQTQPGVQKWSPGVEEDTIPASSNESVNQPASLSRAGGMLKIMKVLHGANTDLLAMLRGCADTFDEVAEEQNVDKEKIADLHVENAKLESEVLDVNKALDEANHKVSIMENVICEFCGPAVMEEICKRLKEGNSSSGEFSTHKRKVGGD